MADPVTLAGISGGATVAGSITGAIGSLMSGEANAGMYKYQSGIARINQQIAKQNADYSRKVGEVEAQTSGMKTKAQIGTIKTAQAASGLDINKGSADDVRDSQHEIGAYDQGIIRSNAARRAYGYEVEAAKDVAQAGAYDRAASNAKDAGVIGAISSILGGAGSVSSKWLDASRTGIGATNPTQGGMGLYSGSQTGSLY